jgi:hypothetical protein
MSPKLYKMVFSIWGWFGTAWYNMVQVTGKELHHGV